MVSPQFIIRGFSNFVVLWMLLLFCANPTNMVADAIRPHTKCVNFFKVTTTNFGTDDQIYNVTKIVAKGFYDRATPTTTYNNIYTYLISSLTPTQMTQGSQMAFCMMLKGMPISGVYTALSQATAAWGVALAALVAQTTTKINSMTLGGRGPNACNEQVYRIIAQFIIQKNMCTLMNVAKNHITPSTYWLAIRSCTGSVVWFTKCGL